MPIFRFLSFVNNDEIANGKQKLQRFKIILRQATVVPKEF